MPITKGYKALLAEATAQIKTYSVSEVQAKMASGSAQLVDIRDIREVAHGTMPGSVHAPRGMLEFWVDPESPYHKTMWADESKEFILFCAASWRSALTAKTLQDMGMTNVAHMDGGWDEWVRLGGAIETLEERKAKKP
jgi:rhodanese-related sulfurtransferase